MQNIKHLPEDLSTAHEVILVQSEAISGLQTEIDALKNAHQELLAELRLLKSGKKREKFINADQMLLEFQEDKELQASLEAARKEAEEEVERINYERTKQKKPRKKSSDSFPAHLPREVIEVAIPELFQQRLESGELVIKRYEITESLKSIPSKLVVLQYKKPILAYANDLDNELATEEEANLGEKGRYHPSIGAQIVHGKFSLHLPYYRIQDLFASTGWTPSRSTLDYVVDLVDEVTGDLIAEMHKRLLESSCIGIDDTFTRLIMPRELPDISGADVDPILVRLHEKMQQAKGEKKESLDAKMWGYTSFDPLRPYDLFDFRVSRHRDGPAEILAGYAGHVMADCYSGNMSVILAPDSKMTRMACWAHARRHLHEHQKNNMEVAALPLALINQLYDIERRGANLSDEERGALRQKESRMLLDRLRTFLDGPAANNLLPSLKLNEALNYLRNHWDALCEYTTCGHLPIDNNQTERLMRRVAVGRKNWLFVGSLRAGMRNANMMSLVSSAYRLDLDVQQYLESVITHRLRGTCRLEELLPDQWKAAHPEAIRVYREEERRDKAQSSAEQAARRRATQKLLNTP